MAAHDPTADTDEMTTDLASGLHVLLVEDNDDDARFVERCVLETQSGSGTPDRQRPVEVVAIERVDRLADGLDFVRSNAPDVVLLDLTLPDSSGLATLDRMVERAPRIPIVVLTGRDDVGIGVEAIQRGAQDYLRKANIQASVLRRTLRYAIEREQNQHELRDRTHRLALLNRIVRKDLRNDVSMVVGRADELRDGVAPEYEPALEALLEAASHAIDLVDTTGELVDVLSADGVSSTPCDLYAVLGTAVDRVEIEREADVTVDSERPDESVMIHGSTMLDSAFRHLLVTAIDYAESSRPEILLSVDGADDRVMVSVAQPGQWLPESHAEFLATGGASSEDSKVGVGLYLLRTVIDAVDGEITVEERPLEGGTTVTIHLRRVQSE